MLHSTKNYSKLLFFSVLYVVTISVAAQAPLIKKWDHRFGGIADDQVSCICQARDSGFIVCGFSTSGIGGDKTQACYGVNDFWIVKTNSLGVFQWDKTFGANANEQLNSAIQTNDGGYLLGGYTASSDTLDVSQTPVGYNDFWIVKIDSLGNKIWDKRYGGPVANQLTSLQQTIDGGYILGGWSSSGIGGNKTEASRGLEDFWIVKIDSTGNQQWDKRFGGSSGDRLVAVQQTYDGGYILGGWSGSGISGDKSDSLWGGVWTDYWIVKINSTGINQWDKRYGGTNQENLYSLKQTSDHGFILLGRSHSGISGDKTQALFGQDDYWMVKTDSLGNIIWDQTFGGNDSEDELGNVEQTSDGGYLASGTSYSNASGNKSENNLGIEQAWIVKTDANGIKQWDKTIFTNGHDEIGYAIQTFDGCYVIANYGPAGVGGYRTENNRGSSDYWVVKFCDTTSNIPNGNFYSNTTKLCDKDCIDFYDISGNNPTSWQWFFPGADDTSSTLQNPTHICYNDTGSFDVILIACNAVGCDTTVFSDYIREYTLPSVTITRSNDTLFSSPAASYQWYSTGTGLIPGETNNFFIGTAGTGYYVIITDSNGCEGTSNTILVTGILSVDSSQDRIIISSNPNNGNFDVTFTESIAKDFSIKIFNSIGALEDNESSFGDKKIHVSIFYPVRGINVVQIINGGKIYRKEVLISN